MLFIFVWLNQENVERLGGSVSGFRVSVGVRFLSLCFCVGGRGGGQVERKSEGYRQSLD